MLPTEDSSLKFKKNENDKMKGKQVLSAEDNRSRNMYIYRK